MRKIPEGYKETELGVIPQEWEVQELNKLSNINPENISQKFDRHEFINYIDIESVSTGKVGSIKKIVFEEAPSRARRKVIKNDIILSTVRPYLKAISIIKSELEVLVCSTGFAVIRATDEIDYKYLFQFLISDYYIGQLMTKMVGSNYPAVNNKDVEFSLVITPPLPEQQKIAEILSSVDEYIEKLDETISEYELLKKGMMKKLLTEGIGHTEFKDTEIGRIPKEWEVRKLGECVDFYNGKAHESEVDFDGKYILVNSKFVSTEGKVKKYTNLELFPLRKDDITMVMSDVPNGKAIAKTFLIDENNKYTLNQRICCLRAIKDIEPRFLNNVVNRNKYYLRFDDGAKQTNLRKNEVLDLLVQLPSLEEQRLISDILDSLNYRIQLYKSEKNDFMQVKKGLMEKLLTGKIRI